MPASIPIAAASTVAFTATLGRRHEYLGFSSGLDFETKIMVKEDAPELLRKELSSRAWKPQLVALSGNTDCYQPIGKEKAADPALLGSLSRVSQSSRHHHQESFW